MRLPGGKHRGKGKIELAMTPMIDIVFNLVIFFLLMPSFEAKEGYLPTNLPTDTGVQKRDPRKLNKLRIDLFHVEPYDSNKDKARVVFNNDEVKDYAELRRRLRETRRGLRSLGKDIATVPVVISPDQVVWQKHVVAAFDSAIDAGFKNIQFTVPK